MGLSFASNPSAQAARLNLARTTSSLSDSFRRLSSGLRIERASDGPAELAVADALRADARIATVAIRNVNDGLSLTAIADSAMDEIGSILNRMAELAGQGANGVYEMSQRSAMEIEFAALGSEIERISAVTTFNGINLLSDSSNIVIQAGLDSSANSQITVQGVEASLSSVGLAPGGSSTLTFSLLGVTTDAAQSASRLALDAVTAAIGSISTRRGVLGAAESRLSVAVEHLTVARDNFVAAESRIRDADIAQEVAEMVRLQVMQQAATAVLAQANQQPAVALSLLQ